MLVETVSRLGQNFGRSVLASLFLLGGTNKLVNFDPTRQSMEGVGLEPAGLLLPIVIALELIGGALVALGRWFVAPAALLLALFTLATNFVFHDFWNMADDRSAHELSLFFKNVSIFGALIFVAAVTNGVDENG